MRVLAVVALSVLGVLAALPASAAEQPKVPQEVAAYFAEGLIPRLVDLYGSGNGVSKGVDFDATTSVGAISRVLEWTPDFLAGIATDTPTRLTNNWVAPVSLRGAVIGLATVWINPADDLPELATFNPPELARRIAAAPAASLLLQDDERSAWFAIDGTVLTPLVEGNSGVKAVTTPEAYQRLLAGRAAAVPESSAPSGVVVAGIVLGVVVLVLIGFVLLPDRRQKKDAVGEAAPEVAATLPPEPEPEPEPELAPELAPAPVKKVAAPKASATKAPATKAPAPKTTSAKTASAKTAPAKKPAASPVLRKGPDDH